MSSRNASSERIIDRLVDDLQPVRPRAAWRDGLQLGALALAELALVLMIGQQRADLHTAMRGTMFWWKMGSVFAVAVAGLAALVLSLDPAEGPRRGRRLIASVAAGALLAGAVIGGIAALPGSVSARLDVREGLLCLRNTLVLSLPMVLAIIWVARRAAPTRPRSVATVAGVAAAGWGAFVFAWSCDHSDPLYVVVWYGTAVLLGAGLGRWLLPRALRW